MFAHKAEGRPCAGFALGRTDNAVSGQRGPPQSARGIRKQVLAQTLDNPRHYHTIGRPSRDQGPGIKPDVDHAKRGNCAAAGPRSSRSVALSGVLPVPFNT
ncbi:hypothetical protein NUM_58720 [Actinocatenispora comari]|uniref:Uncharacterized protein n=1 Tax=Actinocatenispora comari TaxID=2807577 RepID=A0A8J4AKW3_9ACTN|nr:hypothetical protein NUM_58720 [Actinocatenispora comari]